MKKRSQRQSRHLDHAQLEQAGGGFAFLAPLLPYAPALATAGWAVASNPATVVRGMTSAGQYAYDAWNWATGVGEGDAGWDFGA